MNETDFRFKDMRMDEHGVDVPMSDCQGEHGLHAPMWDRCGKASLIETLRDKFAMAALPALISKYNDKQVTVMAYHFADAMLEARKK